MTVRLTIDGRNVEVSPGATILDAARRLGIEVPTLCHAEGVPPAGSCFLCVVRVEGRANLVPSCVAPAEEGMVVTTASDEIRAARRTALELLLSDHVGDCVAPCTRACPAGMDIPAMIRHIRQGEHRQALAVIKDRIPFAGVLGRICARYCERVCRRGELDEPIAICALKRFPADVALEADECDLPPRKASSGKRVAIVGAGPAGLSAAFYLLRDGHACTVYDANEEPGGLLRYGVPESRLPRRALDAEIEVVRRLGAEFRMGRRLGEDLDLDALRREHDAVLIAVGAWADGVAVGPDAERARRADVALFKRLGLGVTARGIVVDRHTLATSSAGVFAAGEAVGGPGAAVRAVAAGRLAALCIGQSLGGGPVTGEHRTVQVLMGKLSEAEHDALFRGIASEPRAKEPTAEAGLPEDEAVREARRCIQCDCLARDTCRLRLYGTEYGAEAGQYAGERRAFKRDASHAEIVYESGKCILCGLCVRIAEQAGARPGITFAGRGFPTVAAVPFGKSVAEGLAEAGARCAAACPTGALALRRPSEKPAE
jgi:ferredoxin